MLYMTKSAPRRDIVKREADVVGGQVPGAGFGGDRSLTA